MPEKKTNSNAGHRDRMKKRYLANGLNGFQPYEIIEFLLFFPIPRCDTNKIAHELINTYKSIEGVLNAEEVFREYQMSRNNNRR